MIKALTLALALLATPAWGATTKVTDTKYLVVLLSGEIKPGDEVAFAREIKSLPLSPEGYRGVQLWLNSPGGDWGTAWRMAEVLRQLHKQGWRIVAAVGPDMFCASACVTIYATSDSRQIISNGQVYVHSAIERGKTEESHDSEAVTLIWARYLASMNVPASVISKLITTAPGEAYRLTDQDLKDWGVTFYGER